MTRFSEHVVVIRTRDWWSLRSRREQVMLGVLAALLGALILWYGVVRPIWTIRTHAWEDIRTYETLNARIRAAGTLAPQPGGGAAPVGGTPVEAVNAIAARLGVVAQVEPAGSGVRATVSDGSYDLVMAWIAEVGGTQPLRVTNVAIQKRPATGRVSATVEFQP